MRKSYEELLMNAPRSWKCTHPPIPSSISPLFV